MNVALKTIVQKGITMQSVKRDKQGRFIKDSMPWNKGKYGYLSEAARKSISETRKRARLTDKQLEGLKKGRGWNKGLKGVLKPNKTSFKLGHKWPKKIKNRRLENLRKRVLLRPNLDMSEDLAYIIGLLMGDGCVFRSTRSYRICLEITDKKIALRFLDSLKRIGLNPFVQEIIPSNGVGKLKRYRVLAHSTIFGEWFKKLSIENLKDNLNTNESITSFLAGFYEAEGNLYIDKNGMPSVSINNTNLQMIKLTKTLGEKLGIKFNLYGPYKNSGGLSTTQAKPLYRVTATSKNAYNFIRITQPCAKNFGE